MSVRARWTAGLLACLLATSGCYGPFNLTRRLYRWNSTVGDKWEREFVFLLLTWAPIYGVTALSDALVFNSMEFWTGRNPVDPPTAFQQGTPAARRLVRGDRELAITPLASAPRQGLLVEQFQEGQLQATLRVEPRDGTLVGMDASGTPILASRLMPDGSILVLGGSGNRVASYSADDVQRVFDASRPATEDPPSE